jgi:hypothetical protein
MRSLLTRRLLITPILTLGVGLGVGGSVGVASAGAATQTLNASDGTVAATLSYQAAAAEPGSGPLSGLQLQISRSGESFYSEPVSSPHCLSACGLEHFAGGPLQVKDLEGDGEPDVVLELNTGGAHCCTVLQVFNLDPGVQAYRLIEKDFGDPGAALVDVAGDGRLEFESADDRFAYAFASYAFSGLPLQIWRLDAGRLVDVTREFPQALAADAARQFRGFLANRRRGLGLGLIAAWAADQETLGHPRLVARTLAREARLGRLRSSEPFTPSGRRFVRKLDRFLERNGYL